MGKSTKRDDPLRAWRSASRVEKSRANSQAQKHPGRLPAWFYRVCGVRFDARKGDYRDGNAHDFDEDLSELEEDSEQGDNADKQFREERGETVEMDDCECGGEDSECDCQSEYDSDDDNDSERSFQGSEADYYYELKEEREERKLEKLEDRKEKARLIEFDKTKEEEVRAAYKSLQKAEKKHKTIPIPIESLAEQGFHLYCSDHVSHAYFPEFAHRTLELYHLDESEGSLNPHLSKEEKQKLGGKTEGFLTGELYLNTDANCSFGPFLAPKRASGKTIKTKSGDGKYELSFKFMGNGYLELKLSREMVFSRPYDSKPPPATAPEVFKFVGIWRDKKKEVAQLKKADAELKEAMAKMRPRSRSPRETWFEMNHPMGAWRQGWW